VITADQIKDLRGAALDFEETERLKAKLAKQRSDTQSFSLTADLFDEILRWKLATQYGRQRAYRAQNTDEIIHEVTRLALNIAHKDEDYELELRVTILTSLRGVGVPVASAVLALVYPENYAVIDFRVWRQIFGENRNTFSIGDYKRYMKEIRRLASELDWPCQEVDHAIWEYDRRHDGDAQ
jgi:thermostable 8-oxoguanine DNA glycosylase